ncbi:unnamed protein product [Gongylonema pulchrum]|uniref:FRIGIDA-like protein n=1 Tax=Gongylonema pulchrum TaxID=637853 RepID=A0A183E1Q3_9BILA|nr:unnamed protein product [Gongylonema pulchrum]
MIAAGNYRDAIACATLFDFQSHFTLNELVIPCMLQDRFVAVDAFIKGEKKLQEELVRYFDGLEYRQKKIMTIPMAKLQKKAIEKLVVRLLSAYNLTAQDVAPNLSRTRREGSLRHITFLYFVENRSS